VIALDPHRNNSQPQAASAPPAGEASRIVDDYVLKVAQVGTCGPVSRLDFRERSLGGTNDG